jgi:hypothetical protein
VPTITRSSQFITSKFRESREINVYSTFHPCSQSVRSSISTLLEILNCNIFLPGMGWILSEGLILYAFLKIWILVLSFWPIKILPVPSQPWIHKTLIKVCRKKAILRLILLKNHLEYKFLNFDRYDLFQSFCF